MKCPLITAGFWADPNIQGFDAIDCLENKCAWWKTDNGTCAILCIAQAGVYLHKALLDIEISMPHAEQFTK